MNDIAYAHIIQGQLKIQGQNDRILVRLLVSLHQHFFAFSKLFLINLDINNLLLTFLQFKSIFDLDISIYHVYSVTKQQVRKIVRILAFNSLNPF